METQERIEIDWLSLSPRTVASVMEISNELGITPHEAFVLMSEEAAEQHPNLPLPLKKGISKHPVKKESPHSDPNKAA